MSQERRNLSPMFDLSNLHHRPLFSKVGKKLRPSFYPHNLKMYKNIDAMFKSYNSSFHQSQDLELSSSNEDSSSPKSPSLFTRAKKPKNGYFSGKGTPKTPFKAKKESSGLPKIRKANLISHDPHSPKFRQQVPKRKRSRAKTNHFGLKTQEEKIAMFYSKSSTKQAKGNSYKTGAKSRDRGRRMRRRRSKSDVMMLRMIQPQNNASWKDKKMHNRLELFIDHKLGLDGYKLSPIEFRQRNGRLMKNMKKTRFRSLKKQEKTLVSSYC